MRVTGTYQNKPKRFGEKRIDLKEEIKGKSRMNHIQIIEKYPFGIGFKILKWISSKFRLKTFLSNQSC